MKQSFDRSGRANLLALLTLGIMAVFIVRLFYLQVIQHSYYVTLARGEQQKQLVLPATRGEIYALDHDTPVKLVLNQTVYTVFADPKVVTKPDAVVALITKVAGGNARPNLASLFKDKESRYQVLATNISNKQAELIKAANLNGIGFTEGTRRVYPEGSLAAQTLGFVDADGMGQYGVEGELNGELSGKNGLLKSVTDISNVPLTIGDDNVNIPKQDGKNVVLTIDRNVQSHVEEALKAGLEKSGAPKGSVVVMDPQTGKIIAMANLPSYDPSNYGDVSDLSVFNNATISAPYEPGSDIKTLTMATGVDQGVVEPDSTYNNTDYITVDDTTITNATKGQTGTITFQHALDYSLNTGFVTVAERLGDGSNITLKARQTMYQYFHDRFRLGMPTGIELSGEVPGTVVLPDDPNGAAVRYSNMAFGQGMDVTMVQVAAAFSSVINGGTYHPPTVLAGTVDDNGDFIKAAPKKATPGVISQSTSDTMRNMIVQARQAFYAKTDKAGFTVGGKTGTSQVLKNGHYVFNETVGTYLGFGGDATPRYVIMVQVSGDGMALAGNTDALPIFTDISNWMLDYLQLQPKG